MTRRSRNDEPTGRIVHTLPPSSATPARDRLTLIVLSGVQAGAVVPVGEDGLVLGRGTGEGCFEDTGLSREHARVFRRQDAWFIEDLGSTNGTFVAGRQIHSARQLHEGDRIQIGRSVLLQVTFQAADEQEAARRLYESAVRDPLTCTFNRRYVEERLASELAYALRHGTALSVLLLDVDRFKAINDSLGHLAGDAVLRVIGGTLLRMVRTEDVVARWGGEELIVVARGTDERNAAIFAERIRSAVEGLTIPWERPVRVTVSIGVATSRPDRPLRDPAALVGAADEALYRAKREGRNRCVSAD